jgi:hypothetical protein
MYYFCFIVWAAFFALAIYQMRPKPPPKPPETSPYDYGDGACDGIGWD